MNKYKINDIHIGMKESFSITVTQEDMKKFLEISGDDSPLHTDPQFAIAHGFRDKISYGMLTAALISRMSGCYLPGNNSMTLGVKVDFVKPVYIGDKLTVTGEVIEIQEEFKQVMLKVAIRNQDNQKVLRGKFKAAFLSIPRGGGINSD